MIEQAGYHHFQKDVFSFESLSAHQRRAMQPVVLIRRAGIFTRLPYILIGDTPEYLKRRLIKLCNARAPATNSVRSRFEHIKRSFIVNSPSLRSS